MNECPNHGGNFDCTPFCEICAGEQEYAVCEYCQEKPVFEHFTSACFDCSFVCMRCEELTGYDRGMAYDELCDDCGVAVGSTPENPWKGE